MASEGVIFSVMRKARVRVGGVVSSLTKEAVFLAGSGGGV